MKDEIFQKLKKFESALIDAWVYDTKIGFDEEYNSKKLKISDQKFNEVEKIRKELLDLIVQL